MGGLLTGNCADGGLGGPKHRIPNLLAVFLNGLRWSTKSSISLVLTNVASWLIPPVPPMHWPLRIGILTECAVTSVCWPLGLGREVSSTLASYGLMANVNGSRLQVAEICS